MAGKRRRRKYPAKHKAFLDRHRHLYDEILEEQGGHCALCPAKPKENRRLSFDHKHSEPMVMRGLLCFNCNSALRERMTPEWLRAAADYKEFYDV